MEERPRNAVSPSLEENFGRLAYEEGGGAQDNLASLDGRVSRYASAKSKADAIMQHALARCNNESDPGKFRAASRISQCGQYLGFRHYLEQDAVRLHSASFCKQKLVCPLCAIRIGAKTLKGYSDRLTALDTIHEGKGFVDQLVTLTIKNGFDLAERFKHLDDSRKALFMSRRNSLRGLCDTEFGQIVAAVGAYEVTWGEGGWHPHVHIWVRGRRLLSQAALKAQWAAITGDSFIVDVRPITGERIGAFCEVFKYAAKFSDLTEEQVWQVWEVLQRRRLIFSIGDLRGVEIPETMLDEELTGPYVEYFYRWFEGTKVYSLGAP